MFRADVVEKYGQYTILGTYFLKVSAMIKQKWANTLEFFTLWTYSMACLAAVNLWKIWRSKDS